MVDLGEPSELKAHWHATVRACRARTQSLEEAEDCASQALLEALAKVGPPPRNPEAFLIRVALRRAVDANRRAMRDGQRAGKLARDLPPDVVDVAEGVVARALARWCVGEAAALPPATQAVFALWADGADAADIAEELQLSKRSVESHLYRTRRTLQSAWARSMAALTGLLWGLKRLTQGAPLAVTAAAMLLALPTLHGATGPPTAFPGPRRQSSCGRQR